MMVECGQEQGHHLMVIVDHSYKLETHLKKFTLLVFDHGLCMVVLTAVTYCLCYLSADMCFIVN